MICNHCEFISSPNRRVTAWNWRHSKTTPPKSIRTTLHRIICDLSSTRTAWNSPTQRGIMWMRFSSRWIGSPRCRICFSTRFSTSAPIRSLSMNWVGDASDVCNQQYIFWIFPDRSNRIDDLLEIFIREKVEFAHNSALILTILHLLKRDLIRKTEPNFLEKVFAILKSDKPTLDVIEYNLSLMHQILMNKSDVLNIWKEQVIIKSILNCFLSFSLS